MDIAKYIGLFLLKNKYCYIPGLGNLDLKRNPARNDGQNLHAPEYDVILSPGGSIDDALSNFIATYEQVSIAKASNELRTFSTDTRAAIAEGKEVIIPALGKFVQQNGATAFITDPGLQYKPTPIPVLQTAKRADDKPAEKISFAANQNVPPPPAKEVQWGKILLYVAAVILIGIACFFGIRALINNEDSGTTSNTVARQDTHIQPQPIDTTQTPKDNSAPVPPPSSTWQIAVQEFHSRKAAESFVAKQIHWGRQMEMIVKDSSNFVAVMKMDGPLSDSTAVLDSLKRTFGAVRVYQ